jgi:hypothetical protein
MAQQVRYSPQMVQVQHHGPMPPEEQQAQPAQQEQMEMTVQTEQQAHKALRVLKVSPAHKALPERVAEADH